MKNKKELFNEMNEKLFTLSFSNNLLKDNVKSNNTEEILENKKVLYNSLNKDSLDNDLFWSVAVTDEMNWNWYQIDLEWIDFERWKSNPAMCDNHDFYYNSVTEAILAKWVKIVKWKLWNSNVILVWFKFNEITENWRQAKQMWMEWFLNSLSVTILPYDWGDEKKGEWNILKSCELWEISFVVIPSYSTARNVETYDKKVSISKNSIEENKENNEKDNKIEENKDNNKDVVIDEAILNRLKSFIK